jgi:hypothetical protein
MAECVSCGKDIPAGKLFCDECYKNMKGRKGALKNVAQPSAAKPGVVEGGGASTMENSVSQSVEDESAVPAGMPEVVKKASGTLTPTSVKKVVSIKPDVDKTVKEKGGKKRFTLTITFSERTYAALGRLKIKKKEGVSDITPITPVEPASPEEPVEAVTPIIGKKGKRKKTGPHGRAKLKAVGKASSSGHQSQGLYERILGYRARKWDMKDTMAAIIASVTMALVIILFFLGWVRFTWYEVEGSPPVTVPIKGMNLGLIAYILLVMTFLAWLYMALTWLLKRPLLNLDFGVVLVVTGALFIIITYIALSSNSLIIHAAGSILSRGEGFQNIVTGFEKQNLWPAYMMVLSGCMLAFSGLIRLSERKAPG